MIKMIVNIIYYWDSDTDVDRREYQYPNKKNIIFRDARIIIIKKYIYIYININIEIEMQMAFEMGCRARAAPLGGRCPSRSMGILRNKKCERWARSTLQRKLGSSVGD